MKAAVVQCARGSRSALMAASGAEGLTDLSIVLHIQIGDLILAKEKARGRARRPESEGLAPQRGGQGKPRPLKEGWQ